MNFQVLPVKGKETLREALILPSLHVCAPNCIWVRLLPRVPAMEGELRCGGIYLPALQMLTLGVFRAHFRSSSSLVRKLWPSEF